MGLYPTSHSSHSVALIRMAPSVTTAALFTIQSILEQGDHCLMNANLTLLLAHVHTRLLLFANLVNILLRSVIVLGTISGFFTNLYNDLTAFALAMATFFFVWAALLYMSANQNE